MWIIWELGVPARDSVGDLEKLTTYTHRKRTIWGFPKIGGTFLGVPAIRTIVFWGLYWGPLILGNYHMSRDCRTRFWLRYS